jgi:Fe(3+) dicitrate transport protein
MEISKKLAAFALLIFTQNAWSQEIDTSKVIILNEVNVSNKLPKNEMERLPEIQGTIIYSGKKNEVIKVSALDADLSTNNPRQIFGKVPGISIWENDGSGIQMGIATRGLSPNRSWEFNVRQNGSDISSEVFGYPESYYSPPMEAVGSIEVVRGAASLQFGPQFGGLLNYVIKKGDATKPLAFESQQTTGSYGLFNSYNAIGGTYKKLSYYAYFHHRAADGWRENSRYAINTGYASINYAATKKLNIGLQYTRMDYQSQQPGGLSDSLFGVDPRQSLRSRNWFSTPWNVAALTMDYEFNETTKLSVKIFGTVAQRNSVGFTKGIQVSDTFNVSINSYNPRQVDRDWYANLGGEFRFLKTYNLAKQKSTLAAGFRVYKGTTTRRQMGIGTTGDDFDLTISTLTNGKEWGRDLNFGTDNYAFFAENIFKFGKRLSITPGLRYEIVNSTAKGYITSTATGNIERGKQNRTVLLVGLGAEYQTTKATNLYANFSQSYRPVTYSELTPSATIDVIDPNLKDASGYNLDFGFRGKFKTFINFDVGGFYLNYDNRIGTITQNNLPFRTNIGTSVSKGIESFIEIDPIRIFTDKARFGNIRLFVSYAYVDAKYTKWNNPSISNDPAKSIEGKRVENAPQNIGRYGATYSYKKFSATYQINQVSEVFTDAANTEKANATSTVGKLDGYTVMDLSLTYLFAEKYNLKAGINNLADTKYATRRAGGYPGPGLLPANGRTMYVSIGVKL